MSALNSRPALRWLVPAAAVVAVLGGGAAVGAITAAADPSLPTRSAAQLLVDLQTARLDGLSGTVVARADLGLPALPGLGGAGSTELTSLLSGTHTLRVWYSGPDKARVALLGTLGETDVIINGSDVWTWDSRANKATHGALNPLGDAKPGEAKPGEAKPGEAKPGAQPGAGTPSLKLPGGGALTPQQIADLALAAVNPSTEVTTQGTASIAGRDAYELVLNPRDRASLIGSIRLAVDATEHVPLRVQIFARGAASPAIEVAFTQVSFARPDPAQFVFNPPPGATVVERDAAKPSQSTPGTVAKPDQSGKPPFVVVGSGWTSVLVARVPQPASDQKGSDQERSGQRQLSGLLANLPAVHGAWGTGHLLTSQLISVLVTDDGRLLVGAVSPARLYLAAADPAAKLPE